jgi:hypothetical protein
MASRLKAKYQLDDMREAHARHLATPRPTDPGDREAYDETTKQYDEEIKSRVRELGPKSKVKPTAAQSDDALVQADDLLKTKAVDDAMARFMAGGVSPWRAITEGAGNASNLIPYVTEQLTQRLLNKGIVIDPDDPNKPREYIKGFKNLPAARPAGSAYIKPENPTGPFPNRVEVKKNNDRLIEQAQAARAAATGAKGPVGPTGPQATATPAYTPASPSGAVPGTPQQAASSIGQAGAATQQAVQAQDPFIPTKDKPTSWWNPKGVAPVPKGRGQIIANPEDLPGSDPDAFKKVDLIPENMGGGDEPSAVNVSEDSRRRSMPAPVAPPPPPKPPAKEPVSATLETSGDILDRGAKLKAPPAANIKLGSLRAMIELVKSGHRSGVKVEEDSFEEPEAFGQAQKSDELSDWGQKKKKPGAGKATDTPAADEKPKAGPLIPEMTNAEPQDGPAQEKYQQGPPASPSAAPQGAAGGPSARTVGGRRQEEMPSTNGSIPFAQASPGEQADRTGMLERIGPKKRRALTPEEQQIMSGNFDAPSAPANKPPDPAQATAGGPPAFQRVKDDTAERIGNMGKENEPLQLRSPAELDRQDARDQRDASGQSLPSPAELDRTEEKRKLDLAMQDPGKARSLGDAPRSATNPWNPLTIEQRTAAPQRYATPASRIKAQEDHLAAARAARTAKPVLSSMFPPSATQSAVSPPETALNREIRAANTRYSRLADPKLRGQDEAAAQEQAQLTSFNQGREPVTSAPTRPQMPRIPTLPQPAMAATPPAAAPQPVQPAPMAQPKPVATAKPMAPAPIPTSQLKTLPTPPAPLAGKSSKGQGSGSHA